MSRRYRSESIEVVAGTDGAPAGFRWRGRRYEVSTVVARWVEALPWWAGSSRAEGASGQRHVWRVEATSRAGTTGVYDLHCIPRGEGRRWGLVRVLD